MERWEEGGGGRGGPCNFGQTPVVSGIRCDLVALEEERNLSLQIIAGNQEWSESGSEFCATEELLERIFQGVGRIFRQKQLALGRQNIFPEDCRPILDIEVEKLTRGVRARIFAASADSQSDDTASGCSRD